MKIKLRNLGWLSAVGILFMAVACSSPQQAAPSASSPAVSTQIPTTKLPAAQARVPTPTAVPPQVKKITEKFATGHRSVSQDWDKLHQDFDSWRQGLIACDPSSVQAALHQFSGDFAGITEIARALPRTSVVRGLSDQLIQAAEREEEALRLLRDTWQPGPAVALKTSDAASLDIRTGDTRGGDTRRGDTRRGDDRIGDISNGLLTDGGESVFEGVAVARSAASALQKEVSDVLSDLQKKTAPGAQSQVEGFSDAVGDLNAAWDLFHRDYDSFRSSEAGRTSIQTVANLGLLVDQFRAVVQAARDLPSAPGTGPVSQLLAEAAEDEDLALRLLRGTFQRPDEKAADDSFNGADFFGGSGGSQGDNRTRNGSSTSQNTETFIASDPNLFDEFDAQIVEANAARRNARQRLAQAQDGVSGDTRAAVELFASEYGLLLKQLDAFHENYDNLRGTEFGCDRTKAVEALGDFAIRFAELSNNVRDLPRATFLRTMGELLVEAVEREEEALRELRNTWRPFDAEVYESLDQQRNTAGKLRRQVSLGIQELLELYGITLTDS